jgi:hypothetical protein
MFTENDMDKKLPKSLKVHKPHKKYSQKTPAITAEEVDKVRGRVLETVKENLPNVRGVLLGNLRWTNQQVKLFQIMLNKVLPDLSASMNEHIHKNRTVDQLTRAELEAIVSAAKRAERVENDKEDAILDAEFTEADDLPAEEAIQQFEDLQNEP